MPPIYDFRCNACSETFESLMQPWDPVQCPECKRPDVERLPAASKSYSIRGDNSASVTPKRLRGAQ